MPAVSSAASQAPGVSGADAGAQEAAGSAGGSAGEAGASAGGSAGEAGGSAGEAGGGEAGGSSRIRVLVAKPGLDGHDRGAKVVARALRDAGMEVVYTGLHQTPEQIVDTAIQEDADGIGLSVLSGAHLTLFERVLDLLRARDAAEVVVFGGGIIPVDDIPLLKAMGVGEIFTPGTTTRDIVAWVRAHVATA